MIKDIMSDDTKPILIEPINLDQVDLDSWSWCAKNSDGWQPVNNEDHARFLIENVDRLWPWLMIEKNNPRHPILTSIARCNYGLILDATLQTGELVRIYRHSLHISRAIPIKEAGIPLRIVQSDELFSVNEAIEICLEWIKEKNLNKDFGVRSQSETN